MRNLRRLELVVTSPVGSFVSRDGFIFFVGWARYLCPRGCDKSLDTRCYAYQMLSGRLPYGVQVAKAQTKSAQRKLTYQSVLDDERTIPFWVDDAIKKATHPDPYKRYGEISEFVYDLRHPNKAFLNKARPPLMERSPVVFWKGVSFGLFLVVLGLLGWGV